jgi:glycosyltransferase involved in cell wall biosynthesis
MELYKSKKIIILTNLSFPVGLAGTNRILSYCRGFLYHGFRPEVWCVRPTETYKNIFNSSVKGNFNGVDFCYLGGTTIRVASFWGRRINDFLAFFHTLQRILFHLRRNEVAFVVFYGNYPFTELSCIFLTRLFKKKIFKEESENPNIYFSQRNSIVGLIIKRFTINTLYRYYSGLFIMTHPLREFFLKKSIPDRNILIVPQTVDIERFEKKTDEFDKPFPYEYIAYIGSLNQQKDGVLTLTESFSEVSARFPLMHLAIAGDGSQQEINLLSALIMQLNLNNKVHYIGRISSDKIPFFLHGAKLLASCRPRSMQSDFGFPTKVVEYLASGKPVVTTVTGELAFYLKDKVNAFIATTADASAFSLKIIEVLQDYDFAMKVAQNGKELVREKFNPIVQTKKIIDYVKYSNELHEKNKSSH